MATIERTASSLSLRGHLTNHVIIAIALAGTTIAVMPRAAAQVSAPAGPTAPAAGNTTGGTPSAAANQPAAATTAGGDVVGGGTTAGEATGLAGPAGPIWTITPSIAVTGSFTDNVRGTATNRQSDFYTTVAPALFVSGEAARLRGTLDYSPQLIRYVQATDQDRIDQNLFADGTASLLRDFLFFDASGSISNQSRSGGRGFGNTSEIASNQATQTIAYSASPYLRFHLGPAVDSELRYRYSETDFSNNTGPVTSPITGQTLGSLSNTRVQEALARVLTNRNLDRLQLGVTADDIRQDSQGSQFSSRDTTGTATFNYRLTEELWALSDGGYERLNYPQQPAIDYMGPTWDLGARYEHNDKQSLSLTYGEHQGHHGFSGQARYAITPLTSVFANYSQQVTSAQQQIAQNLGNATQTTPGVTIDQTTGLPLAITNPNLSLQNSVYLSRVLTAGVTTSRERDRYNLYFDRTENRTLAGPASNQETTGGYFSWSRELSPQASGNLLAGYSTTSPGSSNNINFSVSYNYSFTESLSASASYSVYYSTGGSYGTGGNSASILTDLITLSVRKTF
jgi:uncharacterized protein (PEP-CTERM system associated)